MMKNIFDLQNPWRSSGYTFPRLPYIRRNIFDDLMEDLSRKRITVLLGARQVGKTFLIKRMIEKLLSGETIIPEQLFYFNFDDFNLISLIENTRDFLTFIETYGVSDRRIYIFLDEAQRVPEIGLLIKKYYDLDLNLKFVVSGSSALQIKSQTKETLTGRKKLFNLYPVFYSEFLEYKGIDLKIDLQRLIKYESEEYERYMEEFVLFGGYPGVVASKSIEEKKDLLREIYYSYVQKDISDFLKVENISGFNRMVKFLASQTASLCKVNEVAKNVRISRYYIDKYLSALEETYVVSFLHPYFTNLGKAIIKTPKLFFLDTGLRNAVFSAFQPLDQRSDTGALIENFVFTELIKSIEKDQLWFYRTSTGTEVDFLIVRGPRTAPIEVKYSISRQKTVPKAFNTLIKNTEIVRGYVITRNFLQKTKAIKMEVLFRPAWSIFNIGTEL